MKAGGVDVVADGREVSSADVEVKQSTRDSASVLHPNTTQTPDIILDNMQDFSDTELRVVLVVVRATLGWRKSADWLTRSQIERRTGRGHTAICNAITSLVERGFILVCDENGIELATPAARKSVGERHAKLIFRLNTERPVQNVDKPCPKNGQGPVQNVDTTTPTQDNTQTLQHSPSVQPRAKASKADLDFLTERFAELQGFRPREDAWLPLQQGFRAMLVKEAYAREQIDDCMSAIAGWGVPWTIATVRRWVAAFVAGKMPAPGKGFPRQDDSLSLQKATVDPEDMVAFNRALQVRQARRSAERIGEAKGASGGG
jgi:hypothetical protein